MRITRDLTTPFVRSRIYAVHMGSLYMHVFVLFVGSYHLENILRLWMHAYRAIMANWNGTIICVYNLTLRRDTFTHTHTYMHTNLRTYTNSHVHTHTVTYTYTWTYTHTHMHTHTLRYGNISENYFHGRNHVVPERRERTSPWQPKDNANSQQTSVNRISPAFMLCSFFDPHPLGPLIRNKAPKLN
jgi:hypothetical protein